MKKLLFLLLLIPALGKSQCMGDSIVSVSPDSLLVGDTLTVTIYYNGPGASTSDSVFLNMNFVTVGNYNVYMHDENDVIAAFHPNDYGNITSKIKITNVNTDTNWRHVLLRTFQNNACGYGLLNTIEPSIYIKDTVHKADTSHPNGINEITNVHKVSIKEVKYYALTGQLYGTYPVKQNNLPNIPLIEEVMYTDNTIKSRELIRIN